MEVLTNGDHVGAVPTNGGNVVNGGDPMEDDGLYPKPMADYDYPWAGSLKPVSNQLFKKDGKGRHEINDPGPCPWAGSLRPVGEGARKHRIGGPRRRKGKDDEEGNAPWMGSLRHVKGPTNSFVKPPPPQFKRYPDEDAPNPYAGSAVNAMQKKEEDEQLERIRVNLREKKTVSNALLKVLMPKLLVEHSSKYEPLGEEESLAIMQEILAMQIGLNSEQNVEDNEEAEQMIRAITHGEISNSLFSQMADDLEEAAQKIKKHKAGPKKSGSKKGIKKATSKLSKESLAATPPPSPQIEMTDVDL